MLFMRLLQLKLTSSAVIKFGDLDDRLELLSTIRTGKETSRIEQKVIKSCFAEMQTTFDVAKVKNHLAVRFHDNFGAFNNYMGIMEDYLNNVSLEYLRNLEQTLIACEDAPHEEILTEYRGMTTKRTTCYDLDLKKRADHYIFLMFNKVDNFNKSIEVLDEIADIVNKNAGYMLSFAIAKTAASAAIKFVTSLDQAYRLNRAFRKWNCVSINDFRKIDEKYLEIGIVIVDDRKTVDELINLLSTIPNLQENLRDYIIAKIDEVGLSANLGTEESLKLIDFDKKLPDCRFKNAIRNELVSRIDTTKK